MWLSVGASSIPERDRGTYKWSIRRLPARDPCAERPIDCQQRLSRGPIGTTRVCPCQDIKGAKVMRRSGSRAGVYVVRAIGIVSNMAEETAELAHGYSPGVEDAVRDAYASSLSCHSLRGDDAFS